MKTSELINQFYMEKVASTAWKRYLSAAEGNISKLKGRAGDLLRESSPRWGSSSADYLQKAKEGINSGKVTPDVTKYIRKTYNPTNKKSIVDTSLKDLNANQREMRRDYLEEHRSGSRTRSGITELAKGKGEDPASAVQKLRKRYYKNNRPEGNPNDYVNIIHGGEHSKIKNFLNTGNTRNITENHMATNRMSTPISREGLMFNSKITDRASAYAKTHADNRLGEPAVLAGKIKKKYLYRNGISDEYSLPKHLYNKIEGSKIFTPKDPEFHKGNFYDHLNK